LGDAITRNEIVCGADLFGNRPEVEEIGQAQPQMGWKVQKVICET
jgi:hypothetical protein